MLNPSFMGMTGFGVGLTGGPIVVQARFLMPDHVAITNALMLFVSHVDRPFCRTYSAGLS